jgi:hypothetical protein
MKKISSMMFMAVLCMLWSEMASAYTVQSGDTLGQLAAKARVSVDELARRNGITKKNHITVGQKLDLEKSTGKSVGLEAKPRKRMNTSIPSTVSQIPSNSGYARVYAHEMRKPFAPRKGGAQDLYGLEYLRHESSIKKHGVSNIGAIEILKSKQEGAVKKRVFLPNGTIVESVSFGKDEVWTGGVLINIQGKPGLDTVMYCSRNQEEECILDGWNCGNYINPRKVKLPEGHPPVTVPTGPTPEKGKPCPDCPADVELNAGFYGSIHDPGGKGETKGLGTYQEMLYWENFKEDCSSEWYWGIGEIGNAYAYEASHTPSQGWGGRIAGQAGVKRLWTNDAGLSRQFILKGRLGWEWSHWENSQKNWFINQSGPVTGLYGEYRHELIYDRLWAWATAEAWFGIGNQKVSTNLEGIEAASRIFANVSAGLDYRLMERLILRGYIGLDFQGWDGQIPFVPGVELRYDLPDDNGLIAVGVQAKIYSALSPTLMGYAKYEGHKKVKKMLREKRQAEVKPAGVGIGGKAGLQLASVDSSDGHPEVVKEVKTEKSKTSDTFERWNPFDVNADK